MNNKVETALQKFSGFNCAQAVLFACSEDENINKNAALKIATGFGAGMGRKQDMCGAVTGGIMSIGIKYGRGENDGIEYTEKTYLKTRELIDKFTERYNTCICLELLKGCDLMTENGRLYFKENDLKNKVCSKCVGSVVEILEEIL